MKNLLGASVPSLEPNLIFGPNANLRETTLLSEGVSKYIGEQTIWSREPLSLLPWSDMCIGYLSTCKYNTEFVILYSFHEAQYMQLNTP